VPITGALLKLDRYRGPGFQVNVKIRTAESKGRQCELSELREVVPNTSESFNLNSKLTEIKKIQKIDCSIQNHHDSERGTMATAGEVNKRSVCTVREREQITMI
jgi:hypothetical protein